MSARGTFQFRHYTLRQAGIVATDELLARQWTEADPEHQGIDPLFWLEQDFDRDSYLLLDPEGALFFWKGIIRLDEMMLKNRIVEMHIQFPPSPGNVTEANALRARISQGLIEGLAWLEAVLLQADVREIYFDSQNPALIRFCKKHLGFAQEGNRLRKQLTTPPGGLQASRKDSKNHVRVN